MGDNIDEKHGVATRAFEDVRPRLSAVAYRMLGSVADAEDAVQDTWVKWQGIDHAVVESADAWLMAACTRRSIDMLRAAHRSRVDYVGQWLPEPVLGEGLNLGEGPVRPDEHAELASSLTMAFMHVLERLTPVERAAYLLRDVFDYDYADIALVLDRSEAACRQIVSRAKKRLSDERVRARVPVDHQEELLASFLGALETGSVDVLVGVLADDVELWGDGGGKVPAAMNVLRGADSVARFLNGVWRKVWQHYVIKPTRVNGAPGALFYLEGRLDGTLSLASDADGRCTRVFVVRNPDKLKHLDGDQRRSEA